MNENQQDNSVTFTYDKNQKLEEAEEKISDILAEAIYSYLIKKKLRGRFLGGQ